MTNPVLTRDPGRSLMATLKRAKKVPEEEIELEEEEVEEISDDEEGSGTGDDNNKVSAGST